MVQKRLPIVIFNANAIHRVIFQSMRCGCNLRNVPLLCFCLEGQAMAQNRRPIVGGYLFNADDLHQVIFLRVI